MMLYIIPYLFYSLLSLFGILLQAEFFSYIQILNAKPDLLLVIAIMAGMKTGRDNGAIAGAVVGLWADLLTGDFFGLHILVYAIIGYLFGILGKKLQLKNYHGYFLSVLLGTVVSGLLFFIGYNLVGVNLAFGQSFGGIILPETFYNCFLILLSFPIIFLYRRFRGLKIGYVDMCGGGMVFITNNEKVDMSFLEQKKSHRKSRKNQSKQKISSHHRRQDQHQNENRHHDDKNKKTDSSRFKKKDVKRFSRREEQKKSRPTFKNKSVKKNKPRSRYHDEE